MKRFGLMIAVAVLASLVSLMTGITHAAPIVEVSKLKGDLTISAATSTTDAFTQLAKQFRKVNKGVKVRLNFGSSSTLVAQIQSGAPSDIMASADLTNLEKLVASGNVVVTPKVFARNTMVIAESKVTRGIDVKATLSAVANGDADAAIVYKTDVSAAKKTVVGIDIPNIQNVKAMYGIAPIRGSKNPANAKAFIDFVLSEQGWQILKSFGFERP